MQKTTGERFIPMLRKFRPGRLVTAVFSVIFVVGMLYAAPGSIRKLRDAVLTRLPFAVPGMPICPDCNIILVNLDTMRADEMPCYGYIRVTTPNLCAFAEKNILFSRFYSQSSFTLDSHMSIFTGLYPTTHHVLEALKDKLNPDIPSFVSVLRNNGYRTVWAGGMDDINLPLDKGIEQGFTEFHHIDGNLPGWREKYEKLLPLFLDGKPTFMFLHTYGPHSPYLPGEGPWQFTKARTFPIVPVTVDEFHPNFFAFYAYVLEDFQGRLNVSQTSESSERNRRIVREMQSAITSRDITMAQHLFWTLPMYEQYDLYIGWYWHVVDRGNPEMIAYMRSMYDERLFQIDADMKALLDFVSRPEIKRKTILIVLSDNGEDIMEHGDFDHGWNIYNTSTHAPFIMSVPRVRSGVFHELIQAVDIYPTLLALVGVPQISPIEGLSMVPILEGRGEQFVGERYLLGQHRGNQIVSIRNSRWKMYKNNSSKKHYVELYDLMTDPLEQHNVLGEHLEIAGRLDQALTRILQVSPQYASVSAEFPGWLDEEKRSKLINDGYF